MKSIQVFFLGLVAVLILSVFPVQDAYADGIIELTLVDIFCEFSPDAVGISEFVAVLEICPIVGLDIDKPIITLLGFNPQTMSLDKIYIENSATCIYDGQDFSGNLVIDQNDLDVNTRGVYTVLYNCQAHPNIVATEVQRTVVVQIKSSGGSSSSTTDGDGIPDIPTLDDIPTTTPPLSFTGDDGDGFSPSDLFSNLFDERLDAQTGETVSGGGGALVENVRSFFGQLDISNIFSQINDTVAVEQITEPQETRGQSIVNAIQDFFRNLFS